MNMLFVAGGTAGHINPAVAVADYFKSQCKDANITFVGTPNGMESKLIPKAGYEFVSIKLRGFQRKPSLKNLVRNISAIYLLAISPVKARKILKRFRPDIVIGTGGYVSGPVLMQAEKLGIKTAIHEQNAYPGITNKTLAKHADLVFLAVEEAKQKLPPCKTIVVGNPVRHSVLTKTKAEARKELNMDDNFCILSFGGSLGAVKVNEIAADVMQWHNRFGEINHIHAMGKLGIECFPKMLKERGVVPSKNARLDIRNYIHNMDTCLAAADLVICRSGALTLAELEATGKPSILIPSPNVAENHQYYNAMVLQKNKAAIVIEEKSYNKDYLIDIIRSFYENRQKLKIYSKNASKLAILDTAKRIYNNINDLLNEESNM